MADIPARYEEINYIYNFEENDETFGGVLNGEYRNKSTRLSAQISNLR